MINFIEESLNEFQRNKGVKKSLQIGGKPEKIEKWLKKYVFKKQVKMGPRLTIDIQGDFILEESFYYGNDSALPEFIKFNKISGDFIFEGPGLDLLNGFPKEVAGDFYIGSTRLLDLENSPIKVGGDYIISNNESKKFTRADVEAVCEVKGNIIV